MRRPTTLLLLVAASTLGIGCRSLSVRGAEPGRLDLLEGQPVGTVDFVPFDHADAQLEGAHGGVGNKSRWFAHVVYGAADAAKDAALQVRLVGERPTQLDVIEGKAGDTGVRIVGATADDAIIVRGEYVYSREVSGLSRAVVATWAGKSWTRAKVSIYRGEERIYTCHLDGKYLGSTYSWGYETLGANEEIGKAIIRIIEKLRRGESVDSEPLTDP